MKNKFLIYSLITDQLELPHS